MTISGPGQSRIASLTAALGTLEPLRVVGRVAAVRGLLVEIAGPVAAMQVGGRIDITVEAGASVACEVIGFSGNNAIVITDYADNLQSEIRKWGEVVTRASIKAD